jgi:flagellar capping protein FliD
LIDFEQQFQDQSSQIKGYLKQIETLKREISDLHGRLKSANEQLAEKLEIIDNQAAELQQRDEQIKQV